MTSGGLVPGLPDLASLAARTAEARGAAMATVVSSDVMNALRAHVENGRIIVDDPTDLPDGTVLQLALVGDGSDLNADERQRVLHAIDEGLAAVRRGEHVDAEEFVTELLAQP